MTALEQRAERTRDELDVARKAERDAYEAARKVARALIKAGHSEKATAARLGVERSTVRRWLGK